MDEFFFLYAISTTVDKNLGEDRGGYDRAQSFAGW
jgi:hypothetical protein